MQDYKFSSEPGGMPVISTTVPAEVIVGSITAPAMLNISADQWML